MRKAKFRLWDYAKGQMVNVDELHFAKDGTLQSASVWSDHTDYTYFISLLGTDATLLQYTGLFDKNVREICEGDILKIFERDYDDYSKGETFTAEVWYERCSRSSYHCPKKATFVAYSKRFYTDHAFLHNDLWEYEVIGNIYENEDLMVE
jgi:uncharacterized phage protein (TIGR01671 family)